MVYSMRKEKGQETRKEITVMTYTLICSQNFISEQSLHDRDVENSFVCKYEMRDRRVRQP